MITHPRAQHPIPQLFQRQPNLQPQPPHQAWVEVKKLLTEYLEKKQL
jgi:hypothetical protein